MTLLSIWTGAWVGRAGILAEMCAFPLLAPEILGPERLRSAEEALRKGLGSRSVRRGAISVLTASFGFLALAPVPLVLILGRQLSLRTDAALLGAIYASALSDEVCRFALVGAVPVMRGEQLPRTVERMARYNWALLNPLEFHRIAKPGILRWVLWILGIPFHVLGVVPFLIVPTLTLSLIRLAQNVLAGGASLRALVFSTGVLMLFGGIAAQFVATF